MLLVDLPLTKIGRVPAVSIRKLKQAQFSTIKQLAGLNSEEAIHELANAAKLSADEIKALAARCKLRQIAGIGTIFEILLELVQINSVEQLALEQPELLHRKLVDINRAERLSRRSPTIDEITSWIETAKSMVKA